MVSQVINGKGFEYALLDALYQTLKSIVNVIVIDNRPYRNAARCFATLSQEDKNSAERSALDAVNFLIKIEPRLSNCINDADSLQLEIVSDEKGQNGDVRDVLIIRAKQGWEIGVSAKNNHYAVKHSRLSNTIDFGEKWMGVKCSKSYFEEIKPIFDELEHIRLESKATKKWSEIGDYHLSVYVPILDAFIKELKRLNENNPKIVPHKIVEYLVGNKDFYKVIKTKNGIEIQAYNMSGTLSSSFNGVKSQAHVPKVKLPDRLIDVTYVPNSKTTVILTLNEGWQISFRIHNASSKVESSLKFDINLISKPATMFSNHSLVL